MKITKILTSLLISLFIILGFNSAVLAEACPNDNGYAGCDPATAPYYCTGSCRASSLVPQCVSGFSAGTYFCDPSAPGCDIGCGGADDCGICSSCTDGYKICSQSSGAGRNCAPVGTSQGTQVSANCTTCTYTGSSGNYTYTCTACPSGFERIGSQCVSAAVKLGSASVSGTDIRQGNANSFVYINNVGASIGTSTIPEATSLNVVGASQFSSPLLVGAPTADGHAATKSYVDDSLASSTGALGFWTQTIGELYTTDLTVNVGIGEDTPTNKLSVSGNITGSGSLRITGTATSSNYFASNLGIGGLPGGYWNRLVDLSGSGNSAYISRTGNTHAIMAASDTGTPVDTGYDFNYSSRQMVLGTITKDPINFIIQGSSKMFLSNDGKLGIGTTGPTSWLHLNGGTGTLATGLSFGDGDTGFYEHSDDVLYLHTSNTLRAIFSNSNIQFGVDTIPTSDITKGLGSATRRWSTFYSSQIADNGTNVGIGTTTPEAKLDVNGSLAVRGPVSLTDSLYIGQGSRLLMVDNSGAVSVTSTIPGGGGDYVSKTGDTMTGGLTFENIPAPGAAIDLNGFNIVGVNKITVTTIDPLYDIGGTKYSTYAPSVVGGVKEEYIGRGQISRCGVDVCSWRLDFSKVAIGSDLWVWRKIVEFNPKTIDVVMTAYGRPALLSYEIEGNQLIFYADRPTEFSYRLIGPRFDWRKWPTLAEDQSEKASLTIE